MCVAKQLALRKKKKAVLSDIWLLGNEYFRQTVQSIGEKTVKSVCVTDSFSDLYISVLQNSERT